MFEGNRIAVSNWDRTHNPYLVAFVEANETATGKYGVGLYKARNRCVQKFGFAVPTEEAVRKIVKHAAKGVIELGAGTGYWASLLSLHVSVEAYDPEPGGSLKSPYHFWKSWFDVERGDHTLLKDRLEKDKALMLCWPDYDVDWSAQAVELFKGNTIIYIGEGSMGCTGNDRFHGLLYDHWKEVDGCWLPQWPGIHDTLEIHVRKEIK